MWTDLFDTLNSVMSSEADSVHRLIPRNPLSAAVLSALMVSIASGVWINFQMIHRQATNPPVEFAAVVTRHVEPGAIVEAYDWEMLFLTNRTFHHPPGELMIDALRIAQFGAPVEIARWYTPPDEARYLVDGPFSKSTGIYRHVVAGDFELIVSAAGYDLYRRRAPA
jgi:hypothetical protein